MASDFDSLWLARANHLLEGGTAPFWRWLGSGGAVQVFAVCVLIYVVSRFKKQSLIPIVLLLAPVGSTDLVCNQLLKPYFGAKRPCVTQPVAGVPCGDDFSMPSGHASNTMAVAVFLGSGPLAVVSLVVGVDRVVLAQHRPSEVGAGWVLGAFIGWLFGMIRIKGQA
jgi:undecaprenyl-diphosphatase